MVSFLIWCPLLFVISSSTGFSSLILSLSLLHRGRLRINSLPYTFFCVLLLPFFISPQGVLEMKLLIKLLQECNLSTKMLIISQNKAAKFSFTLQLIIRNIGENEMKCTFLLTSLSSASEFGTNSYFLSLFRINFSYIIFYVVKLTRACSSRGYWNHCLLAPPKSAFVAKHNPPTSPTRTDVAEL